MLSRGSDFLVTLFPLLSSFHRSGAPGHHALQGTAAGPIHWTGVLLHFPALMGWELRCRGINGEGGCSATPALIGGGSQRSDPHAFQVMAHSRDMPSPYEMGIPL